MITSGWKKWGWFLFLPQDLGFSYIHLYRQKSQHNHVNPEVLTTVQSNDGAQNNKREKSEARLFWQFEPHVIMKIGALQYISVITYTVLYVCVYYLFSYTVNHKPSEEALVEG